MPEAETVTDHVLLAQFALCPVRTDAMAQGAEDSDEARAAQGAFLAAIGMTPPAVQ